MSNLPRYLSGDKVKMRDTDTSGRVASYTVDANGIRYSVTWWSNGSVNERMFTESDLEEA